MRTSQLTTIRASDTVRQIASINVAPIVDVMLAMLVIFMVSTPLVTTSLKLDAPPATPGSYSELPPEPLYVAIFASGQLTLNQQPTRLESLATDACALVGTGSDCTQKRIFLRAEPEVKYASVMGVMNALNAGGFNEVGILNEDIR
jgi:Biopolymer transport protein